MVGNTARLGILVTPLDFPLHRPGRINGVACSSHWLATVIITIGDHEFKAGGRGEIIINTQRVVAVLLPIFHPVSFGNHAPVGNSRTAKVRIVHPKRSHRHANRIDFALLKGPGQINVEWSVIGPVITDGRTVN